MDFQNYIKRNKKGIVFTIIGIAVLSALLLRIPSAFSQSGTQQPELSFIEMYQTNKTWSITLTGPANYVKHSNSQDIGFYSIPNGTYNYTVKVPGYVVSGATGKVRVKQGIYTYIDLGLGVMNCKLNCAPGTMGLTSLFLPNGTYWSATLSLPKGDQFKQTRSADITFDNGVIKFSTINFSAIYGDYRVHINQNAVPGYASSFINHPLDVNSGYYSDQEVTFTKCPSYPLNCTSPRELIIFQEFNLNSGTRWSVTMNNLTEYSTTQFINFTEQPGTYNYTIHDTANGSDRYSPYYPKGSVSVSTIGLWTCVAAPFNTLNITRHPLLGQVQKLVSTYNDSQGVSEQQSSQSDSLCW